MPPSGANVRPERRPLRENSLARSMLNASTRVEGSDRRPCRPRSGRPAAWRSRRSRSGRRWTATAGRPLRNRSRPAPARPSRRCRSMERSRTGRVIMPAWQNRQPRVQPRKISTLIRSCTVSASGTSGVFGIGPLVEVHHGVLADPLGHALAVRGDRRDSTVGAVADVVEARDVDAAGRRQPQQQLRRVHPAGPAPSSRARSR